ncbi:MAG TPA: hypothetical protein VNT81_09315 [Vicinamibacterales bacterium]|nr:hypothetical protein [Vicinamibacterales bacterium]
MRISVCRVYAVVILGMLGLAASATTASAQYRPQAREAAVVGEDYRFEVGYGWWNAEPSLIVNSESLGILGSDVDLISDLGIEQHRLGKLDVVIKPGRKHRLRYQHLPIKYQTDAFPVTREFVFNGQRFTVGLPVTTNVDFTTDTFGYEWDFLYFPRGFIGAGVNVMLTNIDVSLESPIGNEFVTQAAPIPAFNFSGRGYLTRNFAIGGEIKFFRIPDSIEKQIDGDGSYTDVDIYGTYNINKYFGVQAGWRKTAIFYTAEQDEGDLKFKGIYFGGIVRY